MSKTNCSDSPARAGAVPADPEGAASCRRCRRLVLAGTIRARRTRVGWFLADHPCWRAGPWRFHACPRITDCTDDAAESRERERGRRWAAGEKEL